MVVYADVLIFLNTIVNFILLSITGLLYSQKIHIMRLAAAALVGGLFSLYILIPQDAAIIEMLVRGVCGAILVIIAFGVRNIKQTLKLWAIMFAVSFIFAGFMMAVWSVFKPEWLLINNGTVYFDISPLMLIILSISAYSIVAVIMLIFRRKQSKETMCEITISCDEKTVTVTALLDTGHNLRDNVFGSPVIIIDTQTGNKLFGHITVNMPVYACGKTDKRFRVIPYSTIGSGGLMPAFRCEWADAIIDGKKYRVNDPVVAVTENKINDTCSAIVNPNIFLE